MNNTKQHFPQHGVTVDAVVLGYNGEALQIVLVKRAIEPYKGAWALPGGFVLANESLEDAVKRELQEEAGLAELYLEQLYTFGDVGRDPRGRIISCAYYGLVRPGSHPVMSGSDASQARWFDVSALPTLAFDHARVVRVALERLRAKISYAPVGFELLPERFTLSHLQRLYEAILDRPLDKRNFRKRFLGLGILKELDERETGVAHRAAQFYQFDVKRYRQLAATGFGMKLV